MIGIIQAYFSYDTIIADEVGLYTYNYQTMAAINPFHTFFFTYPLNGIPHNNIR